MTMPNRQDRRAAFRRRVAAMSEDEFAAIVDRIDKTDFSARFDKTEIAELLALDPATLVERIVPDFLDEEGA